MSNCITLHDHTVRFPPSHFDVEKYREIMEEHAKHPASPELGDSFCWFLRDNSEINEENVLVVEFGRGRSSHTHRDFKQTLRFLSQFVTRPMSHRFLASDEYDGFNSVFPLIIEFPYDTD